MTYMHTCTSKKNQFYCYKNDYFNQFTFF